MSQPGFTRRNSRKQVSRLGETVKLVHKTGSESSFGTDYSPTTDSPHEIPAIIDPNGESTAVGLFGYETEHDMTFVTRDDGPATDIEDGGADHSSDIWFMDICWRVESVDRWRDNGLYVVSCDEVDQPGYEL